MRAAGAAPTSFAEMAAAYPDLFRSADVARMALTREAQNPEQTPIEREEGPAAENPEQTPIGERSPVAENAGRTSVEGGLSAENPEGRAATPAVNRASIMRRARLRAEPRRKRCEILLSFREPPRTSVSGRFVWWLF